MRPAVFFLAVACTASPLSAADLTVGPPGSGADFASIQLAVDAVAGPGDTVFVLPGTYTGSIVIEKDVDLVGAGAGLVRIVQTAGPTTAVPHVTIRNLGLGQRARVVGFELVDATVTGQVVLPEHGLVVEDCDGHVTLADLRWTPDVPGPQAPFELASLLRVESSGQVLVDRCELSAASTARNTSGVGASALTATSSEVFVNGTVLVAGDGLDAEGGAALVLDGSEVFASGVSVTGGSGSAALVAPAPGGGAGAVLANGSRLELQGSTTTLVTGGTGGALLVPGPGFGSGGPGAALTGGSVALLTGGAGLIGGPDGDGTGTGPPVVQDATSDLFLGFEPHLGLQVDATVLQPSQVFQLDVVGLSFSTVGLFLGTDTSAPQFVGGFAGVALIKPATAFQLALVQTDFFGEATAQIQVPPNAPPGLRGYVQAVDLGLAVNPSISLPAYVQVGL